jgi:hypothetical protein
METEMDLNQILIDLAREATGDHETAVVDAELAG